MWDLSSLARGSNSVPPALQVQSLNHQGSPAFTSCVMYIFVFLLPWAAHSHLTNFLMLSAWSLLPWTSNVLKLPLVKPFCLMDLNIVYVLTVPTLMRRAPALTPLFWVPNSHFNLPPPRFPLGFLNLGVADTEFKLSPLQTYSAAGFPISVQP